MKRARRQQPADFAALGLVLGGILAALQRRGSLDLDELKDMVRTHSEAVRKLPGSASDVVQRAQLQGAYEETMETLVGVAQAFLDECAIAASSTPAAVDSVNAPQPAAPLQPNGVGGATPDDEIARFPLIGTSRFPGLGPPDFLG